MTGRAALARRVRFDRFELDLEARVLECSGRRIHLAEQPFQVLAELLEQPGQVVARDRLRRRLWPEGTFVDFDTAINTAVRKLRSALDDSADAPRFIETVVKRGYRFLAAVEAVAQPQPTRRSLYQLVWGTRELPLALGTNLVGRGEDAALRLDVHSVSRHHARVIVEGEEALIEDLGSKNGTWVGERKVTAPVRLQDGDSIRFGTVPTVFRRSRAAPTTLTVGTTTP